MNVILIYTDDQGYGDSAYLNKEAKFDTPCIDSIARDGIAFTDAHCSSAVCTPSRYGILTGRYNWRTKLKSGVMGAEGDCMITEDRSTIANLFKRNGFYTMMVGKWHLGMQVPGDFGNRDWNSDIKQGPVDRGFDYFYGIPASMNFGILSYIENRRFLEPATVFTAKKPINKAINDFHYTPPYEKTLELDHYEYLTPHETIEIAPSFKDEETLQIFTDKAMQKIRQCSSDDKPFFLYLALNSPHKPVCPAKAFKDKSDAGRYGDFMMETDYHVGRILDCLKELSIEDDTMVIFTSDNGAESTYVKRKEKFGHDSSGGFRGGKRDIYEGGHRVPFFVKYPKLIQGGRKCAEPICQTDLFATFADILADKTKPNEAEDSKSILPALKSDSYEKGFRGTIINHSCGGYFAVRDGGWKLNLVSGNGAAEKPTWEGEPRYELYNLDADPAESKNLIDEHPDIAQNLINIITDFVLRGRSTEGANSKNDTNNSWDQLVWMKNIT